MSYAIIALWIGLICCGLVASIEMYKLFTKGEVNYISLIPMTAFTIMDAVLLILIYLNKI